MDCLSVHLTAPLPSRSMWIRFAESQTVRAQQCSRTSRRRKTRSGSRPATLLTRHASSAAPSTPPTPAPGHRTYRACAAPNRLTCDSICFTLSVLGHEPHPRRGAICLVHHAPRVSAVTPGAALTFAARFTSAERKHQLQRFLSKAPARGCPEVPPRHF